MEQQISNGLCGQCQTIFNGKNMFKDNYATNAGGAIAYFS
jgi:hypothetical protein